MLPVGAGKGATTGQILVYIVLLVAISLLPWALGFVGTIYAAIAVICRAIFVFARILAAQEQRSPRCFPPVIFYLILLFAALLADRRGDPSFDSGLVIRTFKRRTIRVSKTFY
jgi:heme o synthase